MLPPGMDRMLAAGWFIPAADVRQDRDRTADAVRSLGIPGIQVWADGPRRATVAPLPELYRAYGGADYETSFRSRQATLSWLCDAIRLRLRDDRFAIGSNHYGIVVQRRGA